MLALTNVAPEVKEMVARGEASVTTALAVDKQCKASGQDTVVHMKEQLAKAKSNGASKITPKSVGTLSALYGRKDIETAAPVLVQLADQLEQAIPFTGQHAGAPDPGADSRWHRVGSAEPEAGPGQLPRGLQVGPAAGRAGHQRRLITGQLTPFAS